ncbi:CLUMA_CG019525, isoform A [Clunio marinus]|uniref:CLUMA_CG019525, isoform A n=1 Tax=Clunio marinus TaxID=568069 RepID=A0A1J1J298_9DIPT|nr:CLUMA_CG019525, isoform A [Clunio marinus]
MSGQLPILGLTHKYFFVTQQDIFNTFHEMYVNGGPSPRKVGLIPHELFIYVDDIEQIKKVYTLPSCNDRPSLYEAFGGVMGMFSSNGALWKKHRKLLNPAFNTTVLKSFLPIFNDNSKALMNALDDHADGNEIDIHSFMAEFALDNILNTSMGFKGDKHADKRKEMLNHMTGTMIVTSAKILHFWKRIKPILMLTEIYKLEKKYFDNGMYKIIKDFVDEKEKTFDIDDVSEKPQILIDQLFKNRNEFSRQEIEDEIFSFIGAGLETSEYSLSKAILLIAMHPEVQEKIVDELKYVFESEDEEVTEDNLSQLTYLDLVMKEVFRYWSIITIIARYTTDEVELGDCLIPKGTHIIIPIYEIHRDKKIWGGDADEFKPERFEPERMKNIPAHAYMPFALGPRNCIGMNYAKKMFKVVMAYFFRKFHVETSLKLEDISLKFELLTKIVQGYKVMITKRDFED